jgi:hypothetical protein
MVIRPLLVRSVVRRSLLRWAALAVVVLCAVACAAAIEEARHGAEEVVPRVGLVELPLQWSLNGARLSASMNPLGLPQASAAAAFTRFVRPSSIAVRGPDLAVVDGGASALYRVDPVNQLMLRLPVNVTPQTRIELMADRTLLLIDGKQRRLLWLTPDGRPQQELTAAAIDLGQPVAMAVDGSTGRIVVADALYGQLTEFQPAGRALRVVPVRDESGAGVTALLALAVNVRGWYLLDTGCRCILIVNRDGRVIGREGVGELTQPVALAVDATGRVFVADSGARALRVFALGRAMQAFTYRQLGVDEIIDLKIDVSTLYIATGLGGRVDARRIVARGPGAPP